MATPLTAATIVSQLVRWKVPHSEYKDWRTHNRDKATGKAWGPVNGVIIHHTGSDSTDQRSYLYNGSSSLPGPLCHFGIDQKGTVHLIGWGRANHAGGGDPNVLKHVIAEDYGDTTLKPKYGEGSKGATDGNDCFYGIEIWYSGSKSMTAAQYDSMLKLTAAILEKHKWTAKSAIGHGEWSNQKWDPGYKSGKMMNMVDIRKDIAATLKKGPVQAVKPATPPPAKPPVAKPNFEAAIKEIKAVLTKYKL